MSAPVVLPGLIALEGLDGTGKSALARRLARRLGALAMRTPSRPYEPLRARLHEQEGSAGSLLYLSSCADAVTRFVRSERRLAVVDRYWFSSVTHHCFVARVPRTRWRAQLASVLAWLPAPSVTVLLHAERRVRLRRLEARRDRGRGLVSPAFERHWFACAEMLNRSLPRARVIWLDTTDDDIDLALQRLLTALAPHLRRRSLVNHAPIR